MSSLHSTLASLLTKVSSKDVNRYFAAPVSIIDAPLYYQHISHPMDFSTMKSKLESGAYSSVESMAEDFYLIWSNCMTFNAKDTPYWKEALRLKKASKSLIESAKGAAAKSQSNKGGNRFTLKFANNNNNSSNNLNEFNPPMGDSAFSSNSSPRPLTNSSVVRPVNSLRFVSMPKKFYAPIVGVMNEELCHGSIAELAELAKIDRSLTAFSGLNNEKRENISDVDKLISPLNYSEYRPFAHLPFDSRYSERISRFTLGDKESNSSELSKYLCKQKLDSIIVDPNLPPIYRAGIDWKPPNKFIADADSFRTKFHPNEPFGLTQKQLINIQKLLENAKTQNLKKELNSSARQTRETTKNEMETKLETKMKIVEKLNFSFIETLLIVDSNGSVIVTIRPRDSLSLIPSSAPDSSLDAAMDVVQLIQQWQANKQIKVNSNSQITKEQQQQISSSAAAIQSSPSNNSVNVHSNVILPIKMSDSTEIDEEKKRAEKERKKQKRAAAANNNNNHNNTINDPQLVARTVDNTINSRSSPPQLEPDAELINKRRRIEAAQIQQQQQQQIMHNNNITNNNNNSNVMNIQSQQTSIINHQSQLPPNSHYHQQSSPLPLSSSTSASMGHFASNSSSPNSNVAPPNSNSNPSSSISSEVRLAYAIYATSVKSGKPLTAAQISETLRERHGMPIKEAQAAVVQLTQILQQRDKDRQIRQQQITTGQQQQSQPINSSHSPPSSISALMHQQQSQNNSGVLPMSNNGNNVGNNSAAPVPHSPADVAAAFRSNLTRLAQYARQHLPNESSASYIASLKAIAQPSEEHAVNQMVIQNRLQQLKSLVQQHQQALAAAQQQQQQQQHGQSQSSMSLPPQILNNR